jgi:glycerophosphoryl diester phosphodiesterase
MVGLMSLPRPLVMAHRGDAVHAPENTLSAFRLALEARADILETDLWLTADDVWVCHHDRTLDRVTDIVGAIPEMTLAQVKRARVLRSYCGQFDEAAYPDERVPTLEELLALTPLDKGLALELKDPRLGIPEQAARLAAKIRFRIEAQMVMLLAFDVDLLWAARAAAPGVWVGEISEANSNPTFAGNGVGTTWQAMQANPRYMDVARAHRLWVCPLDPSPEERLDWYLALGVDAVLSDDPARTRAALALRQKGSQGIN